MHYSFSTMLMALLASNILVIIIAICFCSRKILINTGYRLLKLFAVLVLIRLLLPFEFSFTSNVILPEAPSRVVAFLRSEQFLFRDRAFSVWNLFELLWLAGIFINIIILAKRQIIFKNYLRKYGTDKTNDINYKPILDDICRQYQKRNSFRIIELPGANVPFIYGLNNPCIVLPEKLSLPSGQLYYVLCHEAMHCFRHDLLVKGGIRILSIIYWWNPAFLLLWKQMDTLQEMGTDKAITRGNHNATAEYAECLLYIKKKAEENAATGLPGKNAFSFLRPHSRTLTNRLTVLLQESKHRARI